MFHRYFYESREGRSKAIARGESFIAVTDPDTQLVRDAQKDNFRRTFINMADIGGRYSALSYFGMVPAALSGVDVVTLLDRGQSRHARRARTEREEESARASRRGDRSQAQSGRDKLTLLTPRPLDHARGLWGRAAHRRIDPARKAKASCRSRESRRLPRATIGNDRLFVCVRLRGSDETARCASSPAPDMPVVDVVLEDELDLGEIFFTWEFATAVAGALLGIDAFDQPNVQESKDNTKRLLEEFKVHWQDDVQTPSRSTQTMPRRSDRCSRSEGGRLRRAHRVRRRDAGARQADRADSRNDRARAARRYDYRLRPAIPSLDRTASQRRRRQTRLPAAHRRWRRRAADSWREVRLRRSLPRAGHRRFRVADERNRRAVSVTLGADVEGGLRTLAETVKAALAKV